MAKEKKIRRGTTAEHASFIGALSEITVDTDKDTLVIHDNSTLGGFPLAREDLSNVSDIPYSKLATLSGGQTIIGNSSNIPTATTITGDISLSSTGEVQISTGVIVDSDISNSAGILDTKLATIQAANKVSISALNIDGGTDLGGAITDDDLIIIDDGGTGTNRKSTVTRIPVYTFSKVYSDIAIGSDGNAQIQPEVILNADISPNAEIAVSKLADGAARQLLQTDAAGTGVEWTSNVDIPGTLDVTSTATFDSIAQFPLGTSAAPTITFVGDNNTGIFSSGGGSVDVTSDGTTILKIDSTGIDVTGSVIGTSTLILNSTGTNEVQLDSGTTGPVNIGTNANAKTITIGNSTSTTTVDIYSGTGGIDITSGTSGNINIISGTTGSVTFDSGTTGNVNVGANANAKTVTVGNTTSTTTLNLRSGTGGVNIVTGTTGAVSIDSGTTGSINIGTGANAKSITVGNNTSTTTVNLNSGTGGINLLTGTTGAVSIDSGTTGAINIGTGANAKTVTVGNSTTTSTLNLLSGSGNINVTGNVIGTSTLTLRSTTTNAVTLDSGTTGAINIGTGANAKSITVGNNTSTTSLSLTSGTGGITLSTGTTGNISIDSGTTGSIGIGTGANVKTITLGNASVSSSIQLNNNVTLPAGRTVTLSGATSGTITLQASAIAGTNTITLPADTGTVALTNYKLSVFASTTSSELATVISDETGSGALVFANTPTLVTPILGTPASGTLTNCTGLPISTGVSGLAAGISTFLGTPSSANLAAAVTDETGTGSLVFANSPTLVTPNLGTPASGTLTNCSGLPISTGVSGLAAGISTFLGTPSSANLAAAVTDETGTGALVFANTPTLVTPVLGAATGTSLSLTGGSVTVRAAATQDAVILSGRAGGTSSFGVTITPTTLTGNRTLTLADGNTTLQAGTMAVTGTGLGQFASTTSSQLAGVISDETGTGSLVFGTSPTISNLILTGSLTAGGSTGTAGYFLQTTGTGVVWAQQPTPASNLPIVDTLDNNTYYPTLAAFSSGTLTQINASSTKLTFNPSTGNLTIGGTLSASSVSATTFTGSLTGNASTATTLQTARTINGVSFDGSANITITSNTPNSVTFNSSGTGAASGATFNGGSAVTVSYNTIGAPSTTGTNATGSWSINVTGSSASCTGNSATATTATFLNTAASSSSVSDIKNRLNSGYWETASATTANGWPETTNSNYHLLASTHSNTGNNYSLQLAADFYTQKLWYRSTNNLGTTAWARVALNTDNLSFFSSTTSSQLAGVISDKTGTGSLVFATSPTLVTPILGTPTSGNLVSCTGYTFANIASKPTTISGYGITDAPTFSGNNAFTGANTFTNTTGQTFRQLATQDGVLIRGRSGGNSSFVVELVPTTLTASRTLTLPDVTGTVVTTGDTGSITSTMIASGTTVTTSTRVSNSIFDILSATLTTTSTAQTTLSSLTATNYISIEYTIQAVQGTNIHTTKILLIEDGTTASISEYGTVTNGSNLASYDADISGGNVRLLVTPASASATKFQVVITAIKV